MNFRECAKLLKEHDGFLLVTHKNPDGDTVCSAAALCRTSICCSIRALASL